MIPKKFPLPDIWIVALWGAILFIPFLGAVHLFDWDEINFAESAREMLVSGNYQQVQINFEPFTEKPPLFFWLQAFSMKIFGVNEFAARLPNALVGIVTLVTIFSLGSTLFNREVAWLWVLFTSGSLTPHLYFKSGIIDPLYNLFIFLAVVQFFYYTLHKSLKHVVFLGVFMGLATITKGPVAIIVVSLCFLAYWAFNKFRLFFHWAHLVLAALVTFLVSAIWFGYETIQNGPDFLLAFLAYQADLFLNPVAGHGQPFWYHPLVLLLGCFPASVMALPSLGFTKKEAFANKEQSFIGIMKLLFWVVLVLFSIVETKIVHYSSLCYLPLTFLAAWQLSKWELAKSKFYKWQIALLTIIGSMIAIIFIVLPLTDNWKSFATPHIDDAFAVASLAINGGWQGWEWLLGAVFLCLLIYITIQLRRQHIARPMFYLLISVSILIPALLKAVVPKIERYSQGPAIDWYIQLSSQDVYIETAGFKSYAQYFYGKVKPFTGEGKLYDFVKAGKLDKDAYMVTKINDYKDHVTPEFEEVERKGGFILFKRKAIIQP
jgi:4-amino-4-deoxy-L-arabinose transferase-like glycosyltransferase